MRNAKTSRNLPTAALRVSLLFVFLSFLINAQGQYKVVHLDKPYNTPGSETGALRVGDTILAYSSMQPSKGRNNQFHFDNTQMQVFQARIARNGKIAKPRPSRWGINTKRDHTGNLALDPYTHDLYFTRAKVGDPSLRCEIWWAKKLKRGWSKPQRLRGSVNLKDFTATQPTVGRLADSTVILYFTSDRPGGIGGLDIWYSLIKNGTSDEPVNLGPQINSPADEITPFYDQPNGVLYFSSNRMGGKGGYDIYCSAGRRNTWQAAEPVCGCLNSEQNDIYFTITERDSATAFPLGGYLSSNRPDSYFWADSMCCNDIYQWGLDSSAVSIRRSEPTDTVDTSTQNSEPKTQNSFIFPLFLYFHNDEPDPMSRKAETEVSYPECQRHYARLRNEYLSHQKNNIDSAMMQLFFDTCVEGNYHHVEALFDYIEEQLDEGHTVTLTIAGYASPVFKNEYNQVLSQRRIGSFINMIRAWRSGMFSDAIDDGRLVVVQRPQGVDKSSELKIQNSELKDPVYSLPAALARRIEILSCEVK